MSETAVIKPGCWINRDTHEGLFERDGIVDDATKDGGGLRVGRPSQR